MSDLLYDTCEDQAIQKFENVKICGHGWTHVFDWNYYDVDLPTKRKRVNTWRICTSGLGDSNFLLTGYYILAIENANQSKRLVVVQEEEQKSY